MPQLILLNGPPGIGKSTLAKRYADDHHGVLNLDIDRLREFIGGGDRFAGTNRAVRELALAMAATHLRGGANVVLPQYLGRVIELERFEAVAEDAGADFVELVLMTERQRALDRFDARNGTDPWQQRVREVVAAQGGRPFLATMYDTLTELLATRPDAIVLTTEEGAVEAAYQAVLRAIPD